MLHLGVIAGMSVADLGRELATFLPQVIDKLSPKVNCRIDLALVGINRRVR